jgi:hypothetical protein
VLCRDGVPVMVLKPDDLNQYGRKYIEGRNPPWSDYALSHVESDNLAKRICALLNRSEEP